MNDALGVVLQMEERELGRIRKLIAGALQRLHEQDVKVRTIRKMIEVRALQDKLIEIRPDIREEARELWNMGYRQVSRKYRMVSRIDGFFNMNGIRFYTDLTKMQDATTLELDPATFEAFRLIEKEHNKPCISSCSEGRCTGFL